MSVPINFIRKRKDPPDCDPINPVLKSQCAEPCVKVSVQDYQNDTNAKILTYKIKSLIKPLNLGEKDPSIRTMNIEFKDGSWIGKLPLGTGGTVDVVLQPDLSPIQNPTYSQPSAPIQQPTYSQPSAPIQPPVPITSETNSFFKDIVPGCLFTAEVFKNAIGSIVDEKEKVFCYQFDIKKHSEYSGEKETLFGLILDVTEDVTESNSNKTFSFCLFKEDGSKFLMVAFTVSDNPSKKINSESVSKFVNGLKYVYDESECITISKNGVNETHGLTNIKKIEPDQVNSTLLEELKKPVGTETFLGASGLVSAEFSMSNYFENPYNEKGSTEEERSNYRSFQRNRTSDDAKKLNKWRENVENLYKKKGGNIKKSKQKKPKRRSIKNQNRRKSRKMRVLT